MNHISRKWEKWFHTCVTLITYILCNDQWILLILGTQVKETTTFCWTNGYCQILLTFWVIWRQYFGNFILEHTVYLRKPTAAKESPFDLLHPWNLRFLGCVTPFLNQNYCRDKIICYKGRNKYSKTKTTLLCYALQAYTGWVTKKSAIVTRAPFCKILNNLWKLASWYYINRLHV